MIRLPLIVAGVALFCAAPALAHIVIAEPKAAAGSYHVATFRVGHGCNGSPTVSLRVEVPASVATARPQPKTGWVMRVERAPLAQPVPTEGGTPQTMRVSAVTWMGRLDAGHFDEFRLLLKVPAEAKTLYFPVLQRCEQGDAAWTQVPGKGQSRQDLKQPAPVLEVTPSLAPSSAHRH